MYGLSIEWATVGLVGGPGAVTTANILQGPSIFPSSSSFTMLLF